MRKEGQGSKNKSPDIVSLYTDQIDTNEKVKND